MKPDRRIKKLAETDDTEISAREGAYGESNIVIHNKLSLDTRAKIAAAFVERWALVAAEMDGEDSAGRQKLRRLTPEELALHACLTVDALYQQFESRGWLITIPGLEESLRFPATTEEQ